MHVERMQDLAYQLKTQLIAWRRDFHCHPELGYEEHRTAGIVAQHLTTLGLEVTTDVGGTGVIGLLRGLEDGPTIGLRADMDALPITDDKDVSYRSQHIGRAHLCGHDAHTAMLMGAASLLCGLGRPAKGHVKFIFQPAEEGLAGAQAMITDGVLADPQVNAMAALHVFPGLPTGSIGIVKGVAHASADGLKIRIIGKGGHAARPHEAIDAIAVAAQVINALQNLTTRMIDPLETVVITIGKIEGGYMGSAIAPEVTMLGTVRTLSAEVRKQMPGLIEQVVSGVAASFGAKCEVVYDESYPVVVNDGDMVDQITDVSERLLGRRVWQTMKPSTGGEDFAFYTEQVPGAIFRIGTSNGGQGSSYPLHHPCFDLDEEALPLGTAMLSAIAWDYLSK